MSTRPSSIDKISDTLMARLETQQAATGNKRPTSPPEGDIPCKRPAIPSTRTNYLPESMTPVIDMSMFGGVPQSAGGLLMPCPQAQTQAKGLVNTESESVDGSSSLSRSPLQAALDQLVSPLNVNVAQSSSAPSGPSTALTHEDSPSDSETDDHATVEESIFSSNDSLSPFLQSILSGAREARDDDVFCSVPGRLSLLSQASKYQVTVGEIRRRLGAPESLNASLLGGILRRAKSKNGGKILREAIQAVGMELPVGRRKSIKISLLTSLVEGEAQQLARDFSCLSQSEFPIKEMAGVSEMNRKKKGVTVERRMEKIAAARELIGEFIQLSQPSHPNAESVPEFKLNEGLAHFDLATHKFGMDAVQTGISTFHRFLEAQKQLMDNVGEWTASSSSPAPSVSSSLSSCSPSVSSIPPQPSPSLQSSRSSAFSQVKSSSSALSSPRPFAVPRIPPSSLSSPSIKSEPSSSSYPSPVPSLHLPISSSSSSTIPSDSSQFTPRPPKIEPAVDLNSAMQIPLQTLFANPQFILALLEQQRQQQQNNQQRPHEP